MTDEFCYKFKTQVIRREEIYRRPRNILRELQGKHSTKIDDLE